MSEEGDELALRVGDADRERVVAELRRHHLDGRLDADEVEERLGRAYAARTLGDLVELMRDLPVLPRAREAPATPVERPRVGGFGLLDFNQTHHLSTSVEEAYAGALDAIVDAMHGYGHRLVDHRAGETLVFEARETPGWVPLVCVFAFPFGLLAAGVKRTTRVRLDFSAERGGGTRLRVSGEARRPVRKAFAALAG